MRYLPPRREAQHTPRTDRPHPPAPYFLLICGPHRYRLGIKVPNSTDETRFFRFLHGVLVYVNVLSGFNAFCCWSLPFLSDWVPGWVLSGFCSGDHLPGSPGSVAKSVTGRVSFTYAFCSRRWCPLCCSAEEASVFRFFSPPSLPARSYNFCKPFSFGLLAMTFLLLLLLILRFYRFYVLRDLNAATFLFFKHFDSFEFGPSTSFSSISIIPLGVLGCSSRGQGRPLQFELPKFYLGGDWNFTSFYYDFPLQLRSTSICLRLARETSKKRFKRLDLTYLT